MATWLPLVSLVIKLPQALDRHLRVEAGISHVYYQILAMLSSAPDRRLSMGALASATGTSRSRLSHAIDSLQRRGWVLRCAGEGDARVQWVRLTDEGMELLRQSAPGHVEEVRRLVFDKLTPAEVEQLRVLMTKLGEGLG